MTRLRAVLAATLCAAVLAPTPAQAWETSTHVGLTEQAALATNLDARLRALGWSGGLFEALTVPEADAPALLASLDQHSPIHGYVPDARGRLHALGWLMAGAALADANVAWAANHFFDPATGKGWSSPSMSLADRVRRGGGRLARLDCGCMGDTCTYVGLDRAPARGVPAPDWVVSRDNPLELTGFLDQYEKAAKARTPGERGRHMAGALVAAGAILHALGDLAVPSRVRSDFAAHDEQIGNDPSDRGSRFERLAGVAWGRLGVPAAAKVITRPSLRGFFTSGTAASGELGLAEWTAGQWFSPGTLPRSVDVGAIKREALAASLAASLARPAPSVPRRLNLMAANQERGATLRDRDGVCLARYRVDHGRLSWWLDDECLLEQAAVILPVAAAYEAGLLAFLLRGELAVTAGPGTVAVSAGTVALGAGTVTILAEDGRGLRTTVTTSSIPGGAAAAALVNGTLPPDTRRAVAVFRGVDAAGEPLVAVGAVVPSP